MDAKAYTCTKFTLLSEFDERSTRHVLGYRYDPTLKVPDYQLCNRAFVTLQVDFPSVLNFVDAEVSVQFTNKTGMADALDPSDSPVVKPSTAIPEAHVIDLLELRTGVPVEIGVTTDSMVRRIAVDKIIGGYVAKSILKIGTPKFTLPQEHREGRELRQIVIRTIVAAVRDI
jgi:hypothetical protein